MKIIFRSLQLLTSSSPIMLRAYVEMITNEVENKSQNFFDSINLKVLNFSALPSCKLHFALFTVVSFRIFLTSSFSMYRVISFLFFILPEFFISQRTERVFFYHCAFRCALICIWNFFFIFHHNSHTWSQQRRWLWGKLFSLFIFELFHRIFLASFLHFRCLHEISMDLKCQRENN